MNKIFDFSDQSIFLVRKDKNPKTVSPELLSKPIKILPIKINQLKYTKPKLVVDKLEKILEQKTLNDVLVTSQKTIKFFRSLDIFETFNIEFDIPRTSRYGNQAINVKCIQKEKKANRSNFDTEFSFPQLKSSLAYFNLRGRGERLNLDSYLSFDRLIAHGTYTQPFVFKNYYSPIGLALSGYMDRITIQSEFPSQITGVSVDLSSTVIKSLFNNKVFQNINKEGLSKLTYTLEKRDTQIPLPYDQQPENQNRIKSSLKYSYEIDKRDTKYLPNSGYLLTTMGEFAGLKLGTKFWKTHTKGQLYLPIFKGLSFGFLGALGMVKSLNEGDYLSMNDRLYQSRSLSLKDIKNTIRSMVDQLQDRPQSNQNENQIKEKKLGFNFEGKVTALLSYHFPFSFKKNKVKVGTSLFIKNEIFSKNLNGETLFDQLKESFINRKTTTGFGFGLFTNNSSYGISFSYNLLKIKDQLKSPTIYFDYNFE
ncbi:sorting and assembly machinery component 50 [Anaeramoeba flamelloides]|uniref:Sorting and assembly machinery component 50 n=1 Tax=Anaeramoeba flamelloides TaxID=1746091 RepID=A0ABQ8X353_9EUKA|nr:sorting and assembly machinery component 50 [Anaeramoeba flamelloides]